MTAAVQIRIALAFVRYGVVNSPPLPLGRSLNVSNFSPAFAQKQRPIAVKEVDNQLAFA